LPNRKRLIQKLVLELK